MAATCTGLGFLQTELSQLACGQAAGVAVAVAMRGGFGLANVPVDSIQNQLLRSEVNLVFLEDLSVKHPDFVVIQQMALQGWFPLGRADLDKAWIPSDYFWLAGKSGFSETELRSMTQGLSRLQGLKRIWQAWNLAAKKP